jgi:hypothetical protein
MMQHLYQINCFIFRPGFVSYVHNWRCIRCNSSVLLLWEIVGDLAVSAGCLQPFLKQSTTVSQVRLNKWISLSQRMR